MTTLLIIADEVIVFVRLDLCSDFNFAGGKFIQKLRKFINFRFLYLFFSVKKPVLISFSGE